MKKISYAIICILAYWCGLINADLQAQSPIKAGVARENITPPLGTIINGDFLPMYAREIHDSLYAKALAFDNGKEKFIFIVVDNMTVDAVLMNEAKAEIHRKTGILPEQIMISSTHSHSTGSVIETATVQADMSYRILMPSKIVNAAVKAVKNLQPAKIAWGHFDLPSYVSCRRWFMKPGFDMISPFGDTDKVWMNPVAGSKYLDHPAGPVDPQVTWLAVKTTGDKWISILSNYSTHYAGVPENTISADYYGELDVQLRSKLNADESFVGIMSNGTSGDVNTFDFLLQRNHPIGNYMKLKKMANEISDSIVTSLGKARWTDKPVFRVASGKTNVTRRQPSPELLANAKSRVSNTDFAKLGTADKASDDIKNSYALDVVKIDFYEPLSYDVPVQAVRIGDGTIGTLPGEFFAETGLKLKKSAPSQYYFTVGLANGQYGYVPPASQFPLGGYETWLCSGSLLEVNAEEKISNTLSGLIRAVNK